MQMTRDEKVFLNAAYIWSYFTESKILKVFLNAAYIWSTLLLLLRIIPK